MAVALPDFSQNFSQSVQKTKEVWTEQVGKAVNSVSEATAEAKSSGASHLCSPPLEIGVLRQEAGGRRQKERGRRKEAEGKRQKEGARRSIFTNMRCSQIFSLRN
ncbi:MULTISPECIES: hypothetical protein [unclassified Microcoleus]|uniref:hypothetical protein n=1 Tax=unclassified Microcoleus TaxID=2642155 RepID=UPI002FD4CDD3